MGVLGGESGDSVFGDFEGNMELDISTLATRGDSRLAKQWGE